MARDDEKKGYMDQRVGRYLEEGLKRQKSRVKWIREGDTNSAYFHRLINHRRRVNAFQGLFLESLWLNFWLNLVTNLMMAFG